MRLTVHPRSLMQHMLSVSDCHSCKSSSLTALMERQAEWSGSACHWGALCRQSAAETPETNAAWVGLCTAEAPVLVSTTSFTHKVLNVKFVRHPIPML